MERAVLPVLSLSISRETLSFDAYCDDYACEYSFGAIMETSKQLDATIASGKKYQGQIGYEVPKDWKKMEVKITTGSSWFSNKELEFKIHNQ